MKITAAMLFLVAGLCTTASASPIHAITDGNQIYGASQSGKWIDDSTVARKLKGGEHYTFYGFDSRLGRGIGGKPAATTDPHCPGQIVANFSHVPDKTVIGIAASWNALPRKPHVESVDQPAFKKVVADYLKANGISNPDVDITQIVRCDIDGRGQDSTIITASYDYFDKSDGSKWPFYVVLLRKSVHDHVVTVPILGDVAQKPDAGLYPTEAKICGLYDLAGDGKMEIVVQANYTDSVMSYIYAVDDGHAKTVLSTGCSS